MKRMPIIVGLTALVIVVGVGFVMSRPKTDANSNKVLPAATTPATRNQERKTELAQIGDALNTYVASRGKLPITLSTTDTEICVTAGTVCKKAKLVDLSFLPGNGYLVTIPNDPVGGPGRYGSGYTIAKDPSGKVRLSAPRAENSATIVILK